MKNKNVIYDSWDRIAPDSETSSRMLSGIISRNRSVRKEKSEEKKTGGFIRPLLAWSAAAACVCIVIAGAVTVIRRQDPDTGRETAENGINIPVPGTEGNDTTGRHETEGILTVLRSAGLEAVTADVDTVSASAAEMPYISPEEMLGLLQNSDTILDCTVKSITRTMVTDDTDGNIWSIMSMTLYVNGAVRGDCGSDTLQVVNASVSNTPGQFLTYPGLEDCRENMRAAFVLRKNGENDTWTIGSSTVNVSDLGSYSVSQVLKYDGELFYYDGCTISLTDSRIMTSTVEGAPLPPPETDHAGSSETCELPPPAAEQESYVGEPEPEPGPEDDANGPNIAVGGPFSNDSFLYGKPMISSFGETAPVTSVPVAGNGEIRYSDALAAAVANYGDTANYRVYTVLFNDGILVPNGYAEINGEAVRLAELGYTVAMETVSSKTEHDGYVTVTRNYYFTLHATCEQLTNFPVSGEYGYFLMLYDEYFGNEASDLPAEYGGAFS